MTGGTFLNAGVLFGFARHSYARLPSAASDSEGGHNDALASLLFSAATLEAFISELAHMGGTVGVMFKHPTTGGLVMSRWLFALAAVLVASVAVVARDDKAAPPSVASGQHEEMKVTLYPTSEVKWVDGPASLPKGAQIAVLEGDPAKEGPFVFRVKVPDGYRVPPHTHPKTERITVISGTFNIGMGERFDPKAMRPMTTGTYGYWPAGMTHFVSATGETVLQFHGTGPWSITYVNPADDPRNANR